jgi:hypothetical protein
LLGCRKYLESQYENPFFQKWWLMLPSRDAEQVRSHYAPLFSEAIQSKAGPVHAALVDAKGFLALPTKDAEVLEPPVLEKLDAMRKEVAAIEAKRPELPAAMGVADAKIVETVPVYIRGNHLTPGKPVERGFPEVLRTSFSNPIFPEKQSGRLELARWLASSENPLTARVFVNRVWRWHFGQGIVSTPDNFGSTGARPEHPELLDWLARRFIETGWSVKELHRQILLSAVYQQSSSLPTIAADQKDPQLVDPENKLFWRARIQRLEAEQIRDAMLVTSESLEPEIGGKTIPLRNREFVFNHTSKDATTYESNRRTVYLPIVRNHLFDMLEQFDYPDPAAPTGSRNSTVVAPQALLMLNAPIVRESSKRLAERLLKLPAAGERVALAYTLLYGRPPEPGELREALRCIDEFAITEPAARAWSLFCQALYAANEFIYLR